MSSTMRAEWKGGQVSIDPSGSAKSNAWIFLHRVEAELRNSPPEFVPRGDNPATYSGLGVPITADWCSHGKPQHLEVFKGTSTAEEWRQDFLNQLAAALAAHEPTNDCPEPTAAQPAGKKGKRAEAAPDSSGGLPAPAT